MSRVPTMPIDQTVSNPPSVNGPLQALRRLLGRRSVQLVLAGWVLVNVLILLTAQGKVIFDRPLLVDETYLDQMLAADVAIAEALALIGIITLLTRRRVQPDLIARLPALSVGARETTTLIVYGVLVQLGGISLGQLLGFNGFSFHLAGTIYGTHRDVEPIEAVIWAAWNVTVYALIPFLIARRRYSATQLNLRSVDRRNDALVVVVVLAIESVAQLAAFGATIFDLSGRQALLGVPLSFALYFAGTVLPTMIFVQCLLVPRYLALTRSIPATVVLGGVTYAALHGYDSWMVFAGPGDIILSVCFLLLLYVAPGMLKTWLTLRTGNAWVHVWAYHAIAPHVIADTPHIVQIFRIR